MKYRVWMALMLWLASITGQAQEITLNFKDTDIHTVTEMVSRITGKNFIIDPRVKGNVTVISSAPLNADSLYAIFLSILRVHGFVAVDDGSVVKILPAASAREEASIVSGPSAEQDEILVEVLPVRHVPAAQMVPILRPLVEKEGHLAAHTNSNTLIVAASRRTTDKIRDMLKQLDQATETEVETIRLRYAPAEEMVRTLQALDTSRRGQGDAPADLAAAIVAETRTNSIVVSGNSGYRERIRSLVKSLDREVKDRRDVHVIYLRYAKAVDLAPIVEKLTSDRLSAEATPAAGADGSTVALGSGSRVTVQADEQTNALIITAQLDNFRDMESVIKKLDIRRAQVLVEALIVEVNEDKAADLGIQWVAVQSDLDIDVGDVVGNIPLTAGTAVGVLSAGNFSFGALAKALDQDADANILSTPSLLTLDNEEAEIIVGREVPFITGSYTQTGNTTNPDSPFTTIQRENVGLTLKITPQISEGGAIRLTIDQQISNILPGAADLINSVDVVTSIRSIRTNVIVDDGSTLVLGGLIDDVVRESESRIPLLGDIPVLGWPFRYRSVEAQKRNLMIFIKPTILRTPVTNLASTEDKYNEIREQQLKRHERGVPLLPEAQQPVLKPLDAAGKPIEGPAVAPLAVPVTSARENEIDMSDIHDYDL